MQAEPFFGGVDDVGPCLRITVLGQGPNAKGAGEAPARLRLVTGFGVDDVHVDFPCLLGVIVLEMATAYPSERFPAERRFWLPFGKLVENLVARPFDEGPALLELGRLRIGLSLIEKVDSLLKLGL